MEVTRHIVVVHHAPLVAEALEMVLVGQGFAVHTAVTYRDALATGSDASARDG
nr:hypothetical protein [Luteibacter rhizovicinus]